ncbi:hypothetical protein ACI6Q5_15405 [Xanthomonas codiaei]|uniref:MFS transporter n=1 Tax=Xanthomonas codiaei TaxID=56463 RepID=A0ABW9MPX4_9XANT|nr:hypothetical protein [Xanthomonas codiaei]
MWQITVNRRAAVAVTALMIACIASNPQLAAAVPLLEMLGIDVFAYLLVSQLGAVLLQGLAPALGDAYARWGPHAAAAIGVCSHLLHRWILAAGELVYPSARGGRRDGLHAHLSASCGQHMPYRFEPDHHFRRVDDERQGQHH